MACVRVEGTGILFPFGPKKSVAYVANSRNDHAHPVQAFVETPYPHVYHIPFFSCPLDALDAPKDADDNNPRDAPLPQRLNCCCAGPACCDDGVEDDG